MNTYVILVYITAVWNMVSTYELNESVVNCTMYKNNLASALSSFTSCAINNSRPITLCEACVNIYIDVLQSYRNLSVLRDSDGPCIENYVNLDKLQILNTLYANSLNLWSRAKCNECFQVDNGSLTTNVSSETIKFNELLDNYISCANKTYQNDTVLCNTCMSLYTKLNDYYNSISDENEKIGMCMDIVDLMNETRAYWSPKCCIFRHHNEIVFLASSIVMFLLTILFYISVKVYTKKKTPAVLKQNRFTASSSQLSNGRVT